MTVGNVASAAVPHLPASPAGAGGPKVASAPTTIKAPTPAPAPVAKDSDGDNDGSGGKVNVLA